MATTLAHLGQSLLSLIPTARHDAGPVNVVPEGRAIHSRPARPDVRRRPGSLEEESARHRLQAGELHWIAGPPGHHRAVAPLCALKEDPHFLLDIRRRLAGNRDREDELGTPLDDDGLIAELESAQFVRAAFA